MKNVHILPTEKPSRLYKNLLTDKLFILENSFMDVSECNREYQNIYITNDEEIKEGDYVCASGGFRFVKTLNKDRAKTFKDDGIVSKQNPSSICHLSNYKKIILTTDNQLIQDGVQAIDNEFLEWFVKNPSCEEVEVEEFEPIYGHQNNSNSVLYKIIIPSVEPKQETLEEVTLAILFHNTYEKLAPSFGYETRLDTKSFETTTPNGMLMIAVCKEIIKWQQQRSYSELFQWLASKDYLSDELLIIQKEFEQFKKK